MSLSSPLSLVLILNIFLVLPEDIEGQAFTSEHHSWHTYQSIKKYDISNGLSQMKVSAIVQDSIGQIWIATRNGLNRITASDIKVFNISDGLPSNRVLDLICTSDGNLSILTSKGVCIYDGERFKTYPSDFNKVQYKMVTHPDYGLIIVSYTDVTVLKNGEFKTISGSFSTNNFEIDDEGIFYSLTDGNMLSRLNLKNHEYSIISPEVNHESKYLSHGLNSIVCHDERCDYFSLYKGLSDKILLTVDHGMIEFKHNDALSFLWTEEHLYPLDHTSQLKPLTTSIIRPKIVLSDKDGYLWIGGENGVEVFCNSAFEQLGETLGKNIWSVSRISERELVMGSYGQGLFSYIDGKLNKLESHAHFFPSSATDNKGNILLPGVGRLTRISSNQITALDYPLLQSAFAVAFDYKRNLTITSNIGKLYIQQEDIIIDSISIDDGLHDHFYIQDIAVDSSGRYWLSSYGGTSSYDPENRSISNYTEANSHLPGGPGVFCSYVDEEGTVWLGGENGLLYVEKDQITKVDNDALSTQIKGIIGINEDHLLLATPHELIVFDKLAYKKNKNANLTYLNDELGYQGIEPGFSPFFRDGNSIYICSSSSVDVLNLDNFKPSSSQSTAIIQSLNDQPLPFYHRDSVLRISGTNTAFIEINSVGHSQAKNIRYSYQLDNTPWSEWQESPNINLQNLSHGTHELKVISGPGSKVNSKSADRIYIEVDLPFYQRKSFLYIIGVLMVTLLGALCFLTISRFLRKRKYQKQLSEARYLRSQLLLSQMSPHFIFNVLASIQTTILFQSKEEANEQLIELSQLMRNYLDVSYRGNTPNQPGHFEITLSKEIELLNSYLGFEQSSSNNHFDYTITVDKEIAPDLELIPPMLFQPYIENAVKHGVLPAKQGGKIDIHFSIIQDKLACSIKDNGLGFHVNKTTNNPNNGRTSFGMKVMRERIAILNELGYNISTQVQSTIGTGTDITLYINNT